MTKTECVNICRLNDDGVCVGCNRTIEEIKNWSSYSQEEREKILNTDEEQKQ